MISYASVCDLYVLQQAWLEIRSGRTVAERSRGAGTDGVTIADWEVDPLQRLQILQAELVNRTYQPSPLLWFHIPRESRAPLPASAGLSGQDGGPDRVRRLGIPTVTDRVVQRAVKNLLEPSWEQVFLPCSHGFRPDRSVFTAVAHVLWHEARGRRWVADADIASYFDAIPHAKLLALVGANADQELVDLIAGWLAVGAHTPGQGVAQGAVISPLLANIYLHPFDSAMVGAGLALVRYADDWVVMCSSQQAAYDALDLAAEVLAGLGLVLNQEKTGVLRFGPDFRFLGAEFRDLEREANHGTVDRGYPGQQAAQGWRAVDRPARW